jgi:hypothetical protein
MGIQRHIQADTGLPFILVPIHKVKIVLASTTDDGGFCSSGIKHGVRTAQRQSCSLRGED